MSTEDVLRESTGHPGQPAGSARSNTGGATDQEALIADVLAGDRKAIAILVQTSTDVVYSFLSRRIDRQEVVEELCQEVFLAAWPQLGRFRKEASLNTWLCAIARHKVADFYSRRLREMPRDGADEDDRGHSEPVELVDFEGSVDRQRTDARIRDILLRMPERYRIVLRWRYWNHRSLGEIAEMTGRTEKAVERLLARSRADFARRWNRE
ncbi:MAG: sigma-70 family RNA polymerase sigma factor [Rhodanobacteraceae bacterium]